MAALAVGPWEEWCSPRAGAWLLYIWHLLGVQGEGGSWGRGVGEAGLR